MTTEDYNKYYVQGSDHYLIPRDELKLLLRENQKLKEKYENAVADYETTMTEKNELKKQLEDLFSENRNLRKKLEKCMTFEDYKDTLHKKIKLETQQKEFIKYMNDIIEDLEIEDVDDEEMKGYLIQRIDTFKEILQKYKEINHIPDDGKKVGDDK